MDARIIFLVTLLTFIALATAADKEFDFGGVNCKAVGKSGKILCGKKTKGGVKNKLKKAFTVEVDYVRQIDDKNKKIPTRSIETLASQEFTISDFDKSGSYQGIEAGNINLTASLTSIEASLTLGVYIFKEAGNITFGSETFEVDKDNLKFIVQVDNYIFCNGSAYPDKCNNKVGKFLEVGIRMKSREGKEGKRETDQEKQERSKDDKKGFKCRKRGNKKCPKNILVVGEDQIVIAEEVLLDGAFSASPTGYPMISLGKNQDVTYRAPLFNDSAVFDPAAAMVGDVEEEEESHASSIQLNVFVFVSMIAALFL